MPTKTSRSPFLHSATCCSSSAVDNPVRRTAAGPVSGSNHQGASSVPPRDRSFSRRSLPRLTIVDSNSGLPISSFSHSSTTRYRLLSSLASQSHRSALTSLAVSPRGKLFYSASQSGVSVYDLRSFFLLDFIRCVAGGAVKAIAFTPDDRVFTGHQDAKIRVWRVSPPLEATANTVDEQQSPSAGQRTSASLHRPLASIPTVTDRFRRFATPENYVAIRRHQKRLWIQHADAVSGLVVGCGLLFSVSWDKTLKIWRTSDLRCLQSILAHDDAINSIVVAPDGTVYTGSADRRIRVWQQLPQEPNKSPCYRRFSLVATLERHRSVVNALALSADGEMLYSGASDGSILVWKRSDSAGGQIEVVGAIRVHRGPIMCLAVVGDLLVSGSTDRTVRVWRRMPNGACCCLAVMEGHGGGVRTVTAHRIRRSESSDEVEYQVCSGGLDGELRVWRVWVPRTDCFDGDNASSRHRIRSP